MMEFEVKSFRKVCSREGWAAFALMGVTQLAAGVLAVVLTLLAPEAFQNPWMNWALSYLPLYLVAFPLLWLIVRRLPAQSPAGAGWRCGAADFAKLLVIGLGVTYLLNYISTFLAALLALLKGAPVDNPLTSMVGHIPSTLLFGVVVAPVMEEVTFRRILLNRLLPLGEGMAVYGSAFLFALFHANLFQIPYAFVLGVMLAMLAMRTGSIRTSILLHIALNATGLLVMPWLAAQGTVGEWAVVLFTVAVIPAGFLIWRRRPAQPGLAPSPWGLAPSVQRKLFLANPGMIAYTALILVLMIMTMLV